MTVIINKRGTEIYETHFHVTAMRISTAWELCLDTRGYKGSPETLFLAIQTSGESCYYSLETHVVKGVSYNG